MVAMIHYHIVRISPDGDAGGTQPIFKVGVFAGAGVDISFIKAIDGQEVIFVD